MINIRKLETELWEAADLLRADSKVTSQEYCMPVLGLIFLLRVLLFRPGFTFLGWLLEVSDLAMLAALIAMPLSMTPVQKKTK